MATENPASFYAKPKINIPTSSVDVGAWGEGGERNSSHFFEVDTASAHGNMYIQ